MERILSSEQMRSADKYTIENLGVSSEVLVQRAGEAVAEEILKRFFGGRVLVCVGKGNNGADGKVIAEILSLRHGFSVSVLNISSGFFKMFEKKYDIIVDCIFGTGLNREVDGKYKTVIENINKSGAFVISCDIPSGLNSDTGKVMGVAVKANLTVAIQEFKLGHFLGQGIDYSGEVISKDIGISIWCDDYAKRLNNDSVRKYFPNRDRNVHKGCFGKTVVIGGSKRFSGSAVLASNALTALKMGAGYSTLVVPDLLFNGLVGVNPECILNAIKDDGEYMLFNKNCLNGYLNSDCIVIGMGVGISQDIYQIIKFLLKNYQKTLIIDADGLNCLAKYGVEVLKNKKCRVVLTPHIMEFSRLSGVEKQIVLDEPIACAQSFAEEFGVCVILKNAVSVITDGKEVYLNTTGCSGMAKAGSGDVLSGVLAGLLSRAEDLTEGCAASCYIFGKAGEHCQRMQNEYTMTASDVISALSTVINSL